MDMLKRNLKYSVQEEKEKYLPMCLKSKQGLYDRPDIPLTTFSLIIVLEETNYVLLVCVLSEYI